MAEAQTTTPTDRPTGGVQLLIDRISSWPLTRKLALVAATIISLALFTVIIIQARTADYQLLYANLTATDAASIVEWLKGKQTPYQLKGNGTTIWIPATFVHEARISLAASGLPQGGGVGFEIFDKQSFALTDFVQKVNYTRALQGELSRTIASLGPVATTRTHIAIPEKRLFKNQQKQASASVILTLHPGRTMNDSQVQGIVHLVSGSVEGLSPEQVTVIDGNGNVLTKTAENSLGGNLSQSMLKYQLEVERHLEERAQSLLDTALGAEKSMVRVTALLDFSQSEKTEELFDSEEPVIRSEQLSEEKSGSEIVGGIPGVQSNLQTNTGQQVSATPPSSKSQKTTNYEISKVISKTINPVGTIKNISVAVLVSDVKTPANDKQPAKTTPRSNAELSSLKNMISGALGLDKTRGDQIEVVSMPFTEKKKISTENAVAENVLYQYLPFVRYGLIFIGGFLVYFLMVRPVIKTVKQDVTEHYKTVEELEAEQQTQQDKVQLHTTDPVNKARESITKDPTFSAHVIKNWINEG